MGYIIREMIRSEVDVAVEWAAREGWNPGIGDAECFYQTDPHGFLMGELDGRMIGCASAVAYDDSFGFFGFYIVHPDFRKQGYGIQLTQAALNYLGDRNVGLDGVLGEVETYKKTDFKFAYCNARYEGVGGGVVSDSVIPLSEVSFEDLVAYDTPLFPTARPRFLRYWIDQPNAVSYGVLRNGKLAGYGMIRPCRIGYKIGPLFADDSEIAENLYNSLAAHAPGAPVFLDTPEPNPEAIALAERHGMIRVFATARMYNKEFPNLPLTRIYGVTSFELG